MISSSPTAIPGGPPTRPPRNADPPATTAPLAELFTATLIWRLADRSLHRRMTSSIRGAITTVTEDHPQLPGTHLRSRTDSLV